jgi:hypothetical protein
LQPLVRDLLDDGASRLAVHLDPAEVRGVVHDYYAGRQERVGELWNLLALRLWLDGCAAAPRQADLPIHVN